MGSNGSGEQLSWIFEVVDKVSGPMKAATTWLMGYRMQMAKLSAEGKFSLGFAESGVNKAHTGAEAFRHKLFESVELAHRLGEALHRAGEKAVHLAKETLGAAANTERQELSIRALAGVEGQKDITAYLDKIELASELRGDEMRRLTMDLLRAGYKQEELSHLIPAALDVAAIAGGGAEGTATAVNAFARIATQGQIGGRQLTGLGINEKVFFNILGKLQGVSAKSAEKKANEGTIDPRRVLKALELAIVAQQGGPLGSTAFEASSTVGANIHKLTDLVGDFFEGLNNESGWGIFRSSLDNVIKLVHPLGPWGKQLQERITSVFNGVMEKLFGRFSGAEGQERLMGILNRVLAAVDSFPKVWEKTVPVLRTVWAVVSGVGGAFFSLAGIVADVVGWAVDLAQIFGLASDSTDGLTNMIKLGVEAWVAYRLAMGIAAVAKGATLAIEGIAIAVRGLSTAMMANPIGLFVGAVALLAALGKWTYDNWDSVVGTFSTFAHLVRDLLTDFDAFKEKLGAIWDLLGGGDASGAFDRMKKDKEFMADMIGVAGGPKALNGAYESGRMLGQAQLEGVRDALEIRSPSRKMMELGELSAAGFEAGMEGAGGGVRLNPKAIPSGRGGGPLFVIENLQVNASDEEGGRRAAGAFRDELQAWLEDYRLELGEEA